jgi:hypothetical protein
VRAQEVADQCLYESGARGISKHARDVALVGLLVVPDGAISMRQYRRRIRETYLQANPECGSFFLIFVLPVLISLVSNWISRWIINRTDMREIRSEAFDSLIESLPRLGMKHTYISSSQSAHGKQSNA